MLIVQAYKVKNLLPSLTCFKKYKNVLCRYEMYDLCCFFVNLFFVIFFY